MSALDRVFRGRGLGQERPLAAIIAGLWRNGEQGVWYDVEAHRDTWNSVGTELLTGAWTFSPGISGNSSAMAFASSTNGAAAMPISAVSGKVYKVTFEITSYTSGSPQVIIGQGVGVPIPTPASLGARELTVTAGSVDGIFRIYAGVVGVGGTYSIRNLSVKEWTGQSLCSLYQDTAGTLPAPMPGQGQVDPPVGLLLDRRLAASTANIASGAAWSALNSTVSSATLPSTATSTASSGVFGFTIAGFFNASRINKWWAVDVQWSGNSGGGSVVAQCGNTYTTLGSSTTGTITFYVYPTTASAVAIYTVSSAVGQQLTVGMVSIRERPGNHAFQATTTSRPTLSARYNICTSTENVAAWTKVNGDTGSVPVITPDAGLAPNGTMTADRCVMERGSGNTSAAFSLVYTGGNFSIATQSIRSVWLKSYSGAPQSVLLYDGSQAVGRVVSVTADWQQFFVIGGTASTGTSLVIGTRGGDPGTYYASGGQQSLDLLVWGIDIRAANDGVGLPPYQRVVDASTYDTVGFPLYLRFDGVDDWLQTGNVDFSGTDVVTMATAYRKLSDAAVGEIFALSGNPTTSSGTFGFYTPESANGTAAAVFFARGASSIISGQRLGAAPISCVAGGWVSISMPYMRYGINQGSSLTSSAATGGGNFGNYPLYIGRRSGTSFPFNGRLYSLIIRGTATPDATIAQVERHLNQKARIY